MAIKHNNLYRILDANFNRAKEGLRVCEDISRFVLNDKSATQRYKILRHKLTKVMSSLGVKAVIQTRDIKGDVGKKSTRTEFKRKKVDDIFYANSQRVKESIRVLEEFAKLFKSRLAEDLKKIRYQMYAVEKKIVERL